MATKLKTFSFFCSTCKEHFSFTGKKKKDAEEKFFEFGHDNTKTKELLPGLVGRYESEK